MNQSLSYKFEHVRYYVCMFISNTLFRPTYLSYINSESGTNDNLSDIEMGNDYSHVFHKSKYIHQICF